MKTQLVLLAGYWVFYFILHSVLASLRVKSFVAGRWPNAMPWYRLGFNLIAVILVLPPLYLVFTIGGEPVWEWQGAWSWVRHLVAATAVFGFIYSLRFYDTSEFSGFRQLRENEQKIEDQERFQLSPLHCFVRHPWYFLGLVLIWTRDMPPAMLVSAVLATLYFVVGSYLEERKLLSYYGESYAEYRRKVPALFPIPWRRLSAEEAIRLQQQANGVTDR